MENRDKEQNMKSNDQPTEKISFKEKMRYKLDRIMEKGTVTMLVMLFLFTVLLSIIVGLVVAAICGGGAGERIWDSLMHTLDPGNLADTTLDSPPNVFFMTLMTVFGIFFTSALIGVINNSFEAKMIELRKGTSRVLEKNHVVILGYNYTLITLLESLIEANMNETDECLIVVVGDEEQEVMKDAIKSHIKDTHNTEILCRSGKTYEEHMLKCANIENARSVIINARDDFHAIKTLLAFKSYITANKPQKEDLFATVVIQDKQYVDAAKHAGGDAVEVVFGKDKISRIIAHACNQRGLCSVFEELLNFSDNELYCEDLDFEPDKRFKDYIHYFDAEIPIGIRKKSGERKVIINPKEGVDDIIEEGDKLIVFEKDNGEIRKHNGELNHDSKNYIVEESINKDDVIDKSMMDLIILGQNDRLNDILKEYDKIAEKGSIVKIVDTEKLKNPLDQYQNIIPQIIETNDCSLESLRSHNEDRAFNILLLTNDDMSDEDADAETIVRLIELDRLAKELDSENRFATTCEIRKSSNQKLAAVIGGDNYVVSSNITSLLATQISENRDLKNVFDELLDTEGSELYMRPVENFVKTDKEVSFDTVIEAAYRKHCVVLGYRKPDIPEKNGIVTCPRRSDRIKFEKGDTLILLAED